MRGIRSLFAGAAALSVPTMACAFAPPSVLSRSRLVLTATIETAVNGATDVDPSSRGFPFVAPIRLTATEKARTVTSLCTSGTLCTSSRAEGIEGAPFGSHVDYVLDDRGSPILLMNEMSMHTANILERPDAVVSLFTQIAAAGDGQDAARCSITGRIERMGEDEDDAPAIRMRYSISHSYADQVMDSPKFHFYRLVPLKIYYVGGFGVSSTWCTPEEYGTASPDILAGEARGMVSKLNERHRDDLKLVARHLLGAPALEEARATAVDRLGLDVRVTNRAARGRKLVTDEFRIGFRIPVMSVEDAKSEVLKIFQEAWEVSEGYIWDSDDDLPGSNVPIVKVAEDSLGLT
mmetsp:Transcript_4479/g.9388  ORF Transcript_4479/g.9388 Transcript_4479/m.9388 type:complete len:349 (+) Transcript_4479:251-1297(+)